MEDIGIIILNYNTSELTVNCVNSIITKSTQEITYKIIIVDNNSRQEEIEKLNPLNKNPRVIIIKNNRNAGFSGGNMEGIKHCSPTYFFFLNNDTLLLNDNLAILFEFMQTHSSVALCSGQVYTKDLKPGINFNYIPDLKLKFLGSGLLRIFDPHNYPKKGTDFKNPAQVPVLNGSSLFVRASVFNNIGGFDTNFFLYCEEEDLAIRIRKSGYKIYLVPGAKYVHLQGESSTKDAVRNYGYLKEFYLSQHYLYRKHFGTVPAFIWRVTQFFRSMRKFYNHRNYVRLAFTILLNPSMKGSMRNSGTGSSK